ncbi:MAG: hypothetical protein PHH20_06915 [Candidatus Omnitrophica bacterium]|nr:hypothetical protein [Candidatus Omnitrophota bacterium]
MKKYLYAALTSLMVFIVPNVHANMIGNGNFQNSDRGTFGSIFIGDWSTTGYSGAIHREFNYPSGLGNAVKIWHDDTSVYQDFAASADRSYSIGGYAYAPGSDAGGARGWDGVCIVEWYRGGIWLGTKISEDEVGRFYGGVDSMDSWKYFQSIVTAPELADSAKLVLTIADNGSNPKSGSIGWDNIYVEAVPEPLSVIVFGAGLSGILLAQFCCARVKKDI